MDYEGFVTRFGRRPVAHRLSRELHAAVASGRAPDEGSPPDAAALDRMFDEWLPRHFTRCTNGSCDEGPLRGNRCDAEYWRGHCRDVAGMMQAIAHLVGGNDFLARSLGASKIAADARNAHEL